MPNTKWKPPCTGRESHLSGLEIIEKSWYEKSEKERKARLKKIKGNLNTKMDQKFMRKQRVNRKKQMQEVERFTAIERENFRLLDRMSQIMTTQHFKEQEAVICPALDKERSRKRDMMKLDQKNQVILHRILKTRPYYDGREWEQDAVKHDSQMTYMCKYPRVLPPMAKNRAEHGNSSVHHSRSNSSIGSATANGRRSRSSLGGAGSSMSLRQSNTPSPAPIGQSHSKLHSNSQHGTTRVARDIDELVAEVSIEESGTPSPQRKGGFVEEAFDESGIEEKGPGTDGEGDYGDDFEDDGVVEEVQD